VYREVEEPAEDLSVSAVFGFHIRWHGRFNVGFKNILEDYIN